MNGKGLLEALTIEKLSIRAKKKEAYYDSYIS